jgi:hypothetical protein
MSTDLQALDIQLDIQDLNDENSIAQINEWAKQVSARLKKIQRQVDNLNKWVYPK